MAACLPFATSPGIRLAHSVRLSRGMYCGKLLNFLSFNPTSFLSSSTGSEEKKSVGGKLRGCVEGVLQPRAPAPDLVLRTLFGALLSSRGSGPSGWLSVGLRSSTYLLVGIFPFCQGIASV
uniref:Uncharacterized protein n=1 Tax=Molossus molossus TaxID=27622 RepID=A0A7J8FZ03_MOLMO|nr:hypothetical protein HJG59_008168 [Molossus molossus]